jgi:DNA invertase Pin-like site-specific DNA recombinase
MATHDCPFSPGESIVAYLRDSGGANQEDSTDRQAQEITRFALQNKLTVARWFIDEARTGRTVKRREQLLDMLNHFRGGATETGVIIWNYERFARNTKDGNFYLAELEFLGKTVHSITDGIPQGPERILFQAFKLYSAEQTSNKISVDVISGLRRLVEVHRAMPGTPPRGFMRGDPIHIGVRRNGVPRIVRKWVPDPEKIPLVQRAFAMRAAGATLTQISVATGLYNSLNCYTTFFNNRIYIGELTFGDLTIPDYCEPVVDKTTWDEVQRIAQRRKLDPSETDHPRRVRSAFKLSGLLHCSECGSPMNGYSIYKLEYYVCSRRKRKHDCTARRIPRAPIEKAILDLLEERLLSLDYLLAVQTEMQNAWTAHVEQNGQARRDVEKQIASIQRKINNITKAITESGHSKALLDTLATLEASHAEQRSAIAKMDDASQPKKFTPPQLKHIAAQLKEELHGENQLTTLRGLIGRIIAKRTDDQIIGVIHFIPLKVYGSVPPRGNKGMHLFDFTIPIRKRKAPIRN